MSDEMDTRPLEYRNPHDESQPPSVWQVFAGIVWGIMFAFTLLLLGVMLVFTVMAATTEPMAADERPYAVVSGAVATVAMGFAARTVFYIMRRQFKPPPRETDWE